MLARLLTPADFGLVATATAFVGIIQIISEFSFDLALIRDQRAGRTEYDTVWTMTIIRGAVTGAILVGGAAAIADFFDEPGLHPILLALGASAFIDGFANVRVVDFRKDLEFRKDFQLMVSAKLVSFATTITLAFLWRNYWALVAGVLANTAARVILSYALLPYLPRFTLKAWREITNFSKWYLVSNIASYLGQRCDTFVIGKIKGPEAVGLFSAAGEIAGLISTELLIPIHRVLNPGFAKLAHDTTAMRETFFKVYTFSALLTFPSVVGIGLVANPLIEIFLGQKWMDAAPFIQVLVLVHVTWLTFSTFYPVYVAMGRQRTLVMSSSLMLGLLAVTMPTGVTFFGTIGVAYAQLASSLIVLFVNFLWLRRILHVPVSRFCSSIWRPISSTVGMAAIVSFCESAGVFGSLATTPLLHLIAMAITGCLSYVALIAALWTLSGKPAGGEVLAFELLREHVISAVMRRRAS
jgi:O-antigen/teichoic acid export membrane protein